MIILLDFRASLLNPSYPSPLTLFERSRKQLSDINVSKYKHVHSLCVFKIKSNAIAASDAKKGHLNAASSGCM